MNSKQKTAVFERIPTWSTQNFAISFRFQVAVDSIWEILMPKQDRIGYVMPYCLLTLYYYHFVRVPQSAWYTYDMRQCTMPQGCRCVCPQFSKTMSHICFLMLIYNNQHDKIYFQMLTCNHLVRVPDNHSKLPRGWLAWRDVYLQSGL